MFDTEEMEEEGKKIIEIRDYVCLEVMKWEEIARKVGRDVIIVYFGDILMNSLSCYKNSEQNVSSYVTKKIYNFKRGL